MLAFVEITILDTRDSETDRFNRLRLHCLCIFHGLRVAWKDAARFSRSQQ